MNKKKLQYTKIISVKGFEMRNILLLSICTAIPLLASSYDMQLSVDSTRFDYAETADGTLLDTEKSGFSDIYGGTLVLMPKQSGWYGSASFARGDTEYVGSLSGTNDPYGSYRGTTSNKTEEYVLGYATRSKLDPEGIIEIPINVGVGYRRWLRQLHSAPGVAGFDELYTWGYFSAGIGMEYHLSSDMSIALLGDYRHAFNAQMYENYHGYTFDLNNVHGYKISVPLEIAIDRQTSFFLQYSYDYWNIGASNVVNGWYEPDSETKNEILSVGLKLSF